jgi:hypothetical protein
MPSTPEAHQPSDPDVDRRRLLYLLSEAVDKVLRLQEMLNNQKLFIMAEHAQEESVSAVDTLITYLNNQCETFLANSDLVAAFLCRRSLNEAQQEGLVTVLAILITGILHVHELLLLLPRESARPQASFLLRDCFGSSDLKAAIVLTNFISAYEYRFEDVLEKLNVDQKERQTLTQGGNVLCQAFADKDNPLAWTVLAHEYGHALDDRNGITKEIIGGGESDTGSEVSGDKERKEKRDIGAFVVAETVADFVAAHVLGPASLLPILFLEMMQPRLKAIEGGWAGHPPTPLRVRLVCEYLASHDVKTTDFEDVFNAYELDYELKLTAMGEDEQKDMRTMGEQANKLLSPLAKDIGKKVDSLGLRRFDERNAENARSLQETLASRRPIASRRRRSDKDILELLTSLKSGESTVEQAYAAFSELNDTPVAASEIVTAGWLYRLLNLESNMKEVFPEAGTSAPDLTAYSEYLKRTDGLLVKSLELAEVLGRLT